MSGRGWLLRAKTAAGGTALVTVAVVLVGCGAAPMATGSRPLPAVPAPTAAAGTPAGAPCWNADERKLVPMENAEGATLEVKQYATAPAMAIDPAKRYTATIVTNKGTIEIEMLPGDAPTTVNNFVCLARDGYYDGTPFHRIVKGFMIQGGDPTGTGSGGPGYRFADEPVRRAYDKGIVAMANAGPNTNGSQFFIMLEDYPLPPNYTIFGRVIAGQEVVDAIGETPVRAGRSGERSTPTEPVRIESVTIAEG